MVQRDRSTELKLIKEYQARREEQKSTAQRLSKTIPNSTLFFGICNMNAEDELNVSDGLLMLRKVSNKPCFMDIYESALKDKNYHFLSVARHIPRIQAELVVGGQDTLDWNKELLLKAAWHTVALLKLCGATNIYCPCVASCSWDLIVISPPHVVDYSLLDDNTNMLALEDNCKITSQDLNWINSNYFNAFELRNANTSRRFELAFNLFYRWNHTEDLRIGLINLWCALDALFGCRKDRPVTTKLLSRICDWLPHLQKEQLKELYNIRSAAVHGRKFNSAEMVKAIIATEKIVKDVMVKCIEQNEKTLPDWE